MRRVLAGFLVLAVVLGVVGVVADRVLHARAEARVAEQISAYLDVTGEPTVSVHGFPFLSQLLAGRFGRVVVEAPGAGTDGIALSDVRATALGVTVTEPARVAELEVVGTLSEAGLQRLVAEQGELDVTVAAHADGVSLATEVLGLDVAARVDPVVTAGGLRLEVTTVTLGGAEVDAGSLAEMLRRDSLSVDLEIPDLPLGMDLTGVDTRDGGVRLTLSGSDVVLAGP